MDHRLRLLGELLFIMTLGICIAHFVVIRQEVWGRSFVFCAAVLPAFGAALAAIRSQGEFHRVVQRGRAMREELEQLRQAVANVPTRSNELSSQLLRQAVEQTSRLMYSEELDWRIVFQDRPLVWPA